MQVQELLLYVGGPLAAKSQQGGMQLEPGKASQGSIGWRSIGNREHTATVDGPSCRQIR
jgi:hypothetical protein